MTVPHSPPAAPDAETSSVYGHSGFISFLIARVVAVVATQVQAVVVAWQVYDLTREPLALAYVGLAQFLPMLALLLPAGDLIDRFDRRRILALAWSVGGVCSALLWWLAGHGASGVAGIYAVLVLYGCARAFSGPAMQSLLPQIVPRGQLAQAIAANSMLMRVASIGGPLLGGLLYALGGGELTYAVCCACFVLGVALLLRVVVAHATAPGPAQGTMFERFGAGITFIRTRPIILGTISLDLFAVLLGGVVALLPIYAQEVLHVGPAGLGALRSAMAVGEVGAGLYLSMRPFNRHVGRTMFIAVAVFGVANLVFALSHWFWLSFCGADGGWRGRHGERVHPRRAGAVLHARHHARAGERGQHAVHRLVQRAGRVPRGHQRRLAGRGARRRGGRTVHAGRGGWLDAGVQDTAHGGPFRGSCAGQQLSR